MRRTRYHCARRPPLLTALRATRWETPPRTCGRTHHYSAVTTTAPYLPIHIYILKISHAKGLTVIGNTTGKGGRRANCLLPESHGEA